MKRTAAPHVRILHDILSISVALGQPSGVVERRIEVRQDDLLERLVRHRQFN
jgi:hypothetical protein